MITAIENINKYVIEKKLNLLNIEKVKVKCGYRYYLHLKCDCGTKFRRDYHKIKSKNSFHCEICTKKIQKIRRAKKAHKEFLKYVECNSNSEIISKEFLGWSEKHKFKCNCDNVFFMTPSDFKSAKFKMCSKCRSKQLSKNMSFSFEYIKAWVFKNTSSELISNYYKNQKTPLTLRCYCGQEYTTNYMILSMGCSYKCPICTNKQRSDRFSLTYKEVKSWIESETELKLLSDNYINNSKKLKLLCSCGEEYKSTLNSLRSGKSLKCNKCTNQTRSKNQAHDYEYVKSWIENNTNLKLLASEYKNYNSKLNVRCSCGELYKTKLATLKKGQALNCPKCNHGLSYAELETDKILSKYGINFEREYRFEDCKYKSLLPFDFYLIDLKTCIELDGEHHFKVVQFGGTKDQAEEEFKHRIIKDSIKNKFCQDNNIKLIRIPYWNFDKIEEILKDEDIVRS